MARSGPLPGRRTPPAAPTRRGQPAHKPATVTRAAVAMRDDWEDQAECRIRGLDPDLFFPEYGEPVDAAVFGACGACQVRQECLTRGMAIEAAAEGSGSKYRHGIWGGLTERQRTGLAKGRTVRFLKPTRDRNRYKRRKAAREADAVVPLMRLQEPVRPSRRSG